MHPIFTIWLSHDQKSSHLIIFSTMNIVKFLIKEGSNLDWECYYPAGTQGRVLRALTTQIYLVQTLYCLLCFKICLWIRTAFPEGGGGYMTCGWTGICRPVFRKVPSSNYRNLRSYPLLWWTLAENHPFFAIFRQFLDNPPFKENLPKKGPLSREFGAQKPTHMGGTCPYPQHVMYPPPRDCVRRRQCKS